MQAQALLVSCNSRDCAYIPGPKFHPGPLTLFSVVPPVSTALPLFVDNFKLLIRRNQAKQWLIVLCRVCSILFTLADLYISGLNYFHIGQIW